MRYSIVSIPDFYPLSHFVSLTTNNVSVFTDKLNVVHICVHMQSAFFCLFDLILYVPSLIFQLNRYGSSWVEPVLS